MSLFYHKTSGIEIAVEAAVGGGELEHTVVGVGDAAGVILLVTVTPDHLLRSGVRQHLHRASQHHPLEAIGIAEVDAGLGIRLVVSHAE